MTVFTYLDRVTPLLGGFLATVLLARYLGRQKFLSIWESEGVLSTRLLLAWIFAGFTLYLEHRALAPEVANLEVLRASIDANLLFVGALLGLGVAKVTASRFAPKPTTDPTEREAEKEESPPT